MFTPTRRLTFTAMVLSISTAAAFSLLTGPAAAETATVELRYAFNNATAATPFNSGTANVSTTVVASAGAGLVSTASRPGQGSAMQFPTFDASLNPVRAIIEVSSAGSSDQLSPGANNFSWGADFDIASTSASEAISSTDNGDNLVQRGLAGGLQYKLELDRDHAACTLRGSTGAAGAVRVVISTAVIPGEWYSASCARTGSELTVELDEYDAAGNVSNSWNESATSPIGFGSLTWADTATPFTIGGKLDKDGNFVSPSSDQFNGVVDNAFYTVTQ